MKTITLGDCEVVLARIKTKEDLQAKKLKYRGKIWRVVSVKCLKERQPCEWVQRGKDEKFN